MIDTLVRAAIVATMFVWVVWWYEESERQAKADEDRAVLLLGVIAARARELVESGVLMRDAFAFAKIELAAGGGSILCVMSRMGSITEAVIWIELPDHPRAMIKYEGRTLMFAGVDDMAYLQRSVIPQSAARDAHLLLRSVIEMVRAYHTSIADAP